MNIIGISGLAGSGKDTVADMMLENSGFVKVSFADPIKRFAKDVWGFSNEQLWGPSELRSAVDEHYPHLTPRKVLQHLGTEGCREIDPDVWARYAIKTASTLLKFKGACYSPEGGVELTHGDSSVRAVVISDVRFKNEVKHIKESDGILIRVVREGAGLKGDFAKHRSEAEMSDIPDSAFHHVIINDGTLDDLRAKVDSIVASIVNS